MAQPNRHLALLRAACRECQLGRLLRSARWKADEVRDEVHSYVLDRLDDPRDRLMVALVAIYALPPQIAHLRRTDLDRSKGRLRLRRVGRLDHVICLDAFTPRLATAWELQRHRRWPDGSNPHFFVTRNTAVDDSGPPISAGVVQHLFQRVGLPARRLRVDRIVDEARNSADPVRLMQLFGLYNLSATRHVLSAHPDKKNGPIAP
ncbi:hypothetical protein [Streptomyces sp. OK228]|uniref:hypothetical protein n=1 Tax=Streptomyces sp. OK228 TaxID=1882786 RepID=UPI000BD66A01|nr:hypothetical protein [Streptomyces sp. OK228]SOE33506.1 hypothetical protein SAMN05442782_10545 [Streptomyces sp. OK228]